MNKAGTDYKLRSFQGIALLLLGFFIYLMADIIFPYLSGRTDIDFLLSKQKIVHLAHYMGAFYVHIFSSVFVLMAGATQFFRSLMLDYPLWHRRIGQAYVALILFISAPGALLMSFYANGNTFSKFNFVVLTLLWWYFTWQAYRCIRRGQWQAHGDFMIRSYALTFSAVTLRVYQYGFGWAGLYRYISPADVYILLSFLSWIPNWILAEYLIMRGTSAWILKKPVRAQQV